MEEHALTGVVMKSAVSLKVVKHAQWIVVSVLSFVVMEFAEEKSTAITVVRTVENAPLLTDAQWMQIQDVQTAAVLIVFVMKIHGAVQAAGMKHVSTDVLTVENHVRITAETASVK